MYKITNVLGNSHVDWITTTDPYSEIVMVTKFLYHDKEVTDDMTFNFGSSAYHFHSKNERMQFALGLEKALDMLIVDK